jgi:hypothetical protein
LPIVVSLVSERSTVESPDLLPFETIWRAKAQRPPALNTLIFVGEGDAVLGATRAGQNGWEGISQNKKHFPDGARTHDQEEEEVIPARAA